VLRELGRGSMGVVLLGQDDATGRQVALKALALVTLLANAGDEEARARFRREAMAAARLTHPDIVQVFDAGETAGVAWIAMELVEGTDLSAWTSGEARLPLREAVLVTARLARALAYAHSQGIVHRDVKPSNVRIDLARSIVKLGDFGVARFADAHRTRTGVLLGTPAYMSPEQLAGGPMDGRSDLHALGVVGYELLTGRLPWDTRSMATLMGQIARMPPPDPRALRRELPRELADVLLVLLQKAPELRYRDGIQLAEDLEQIARTWVSSDEPSSINARQASATEGTIPAKT